MSKSHPGKFQNLEFGASEAAQVAARRAGLSVREWIETVVADKADELGVHEYDLDEDERLDAVVERLTRLKLRRPRGDSHESRHSALRAQRADLEAGSRTPYPARTSPYRAGVSDTHVLSRVIDQLDTIEQRLARTERSAGAVRDFSTSTSANDESVLAQALARLEARMAQQAAPRERRQNASVRSLHQADRVDYDALSGRDAIFSTLESQIQALKTSLDARNRPANMPERDSPAQSAPPMPRNRQTAETGSRPASLFAASLEQLHDEISRLATEMAAMRNPQPNSEIAILRQDLVKMAQIVADLAPKRSIEDLEGRLTHLLQKMSSTKDEALARTVLSPVADLVVELRESMKGLAPHDGLKAIERQIYDLSQKVAVLETGSHDPAAFAALQQQSQKIYNMVQQMASRPDAFDAIEHRIGYLTEKIENIALVPEQFSSDEIIRTINEIRHQVERKLASGNVESLERRIEELSGKIDQMLGRPKALPESAGTRTAGSASLERMARNLETKMNEASQPAADAQAFAALQQQMSAILSQMDRSQSSLSVLTSLEQSMKNLFSELDSTRQIAVEAAERAAQKAVRDSTRQILEHLPQSAALPQVEQLSRSLQEMQQSQDAVDQRAQATLAAVHEVLAKLTDRLVLIEQDLAEVKDHPGAVPAAQVPRPKPVVAPAMPRAQAFTAGRATAPADSLEEDVLLEPRAGARATHGSSVPGVEPDEALHFPARDDEAPAQNAHSTKAAFIAAARRAVQTAAQSTQDDFDSMSDNLDMPLNRITPASLLERARAFAESRKRPLLLGLAAVMMAVLGMQLARNISVNEADRAVPPPVTVTAAPQSNPAPAKTMGDSTAKPATPDAMPAVRMISPAANPPPETKAPDMPAEAPAVPDNKPAQPPAASSLAPPEAPPAPAVKGLPPGPSSLNDMSASPSRFVKGVMALNSRGFTMTRPEGASGLADVPGKVGAVSQPSFPLQANITAQPKLETMPSGLMAAAQAGNAAAQYEMGMRYLDGRGELRDFKTAALWFEKAASQGLAPAQYRLGAFYEKGLGVTRDLAKAKTYYELAAKSGNPRAMHNLAVLTAEGVNGSSDYPNAVNWFRQASEYGIRDSQYNLAVLYARGIGVAQNLTQSYIWFALAAAQGDDDAAHKRDDVAARLDAASLQSARASVSSFHSRVADPAAVDVMTPAGGWETYVPKSINTSANIMPTGKFL